MNRLLLTASRSVAPSLRINHGALSSSTAQSFLSARQFSDSAAAADAGTTTNDSAEKIQVGTVKTFSYTNQYGFIIPDGVDPNDHDKNKDLIFVHRKAIKTMEFEDGEKFFPGLKRGQRVQYKVGPPDEGKLMAKAHDLTQEGGKLIPPFRPGYIEEFTRNQKSRLGHEAFDIFSTAQDQSELEIKLVAAYDKVLEDIEKQKTRVERAKELTGEKDEKKEE